MQNSIELFSIEKKVGKIVYRYNINGEWKKVFRTEREYFIDYGEDVSNVPDSILVVPFLANILPIAWVYDAEIKLDEIDKDFIECIDEIKRTYVKMFPKIEFKGSIVFNRKVLNKQKSNCNKSLLFFSGGVDATSSLINVVNEKPMLCTLWGSDIFFHDVDGWRNLTEQVEKTANKFNLPFAFVKTSFRHILDYNILNDEFAKPNRENWWHGFQHGMGIIGHAAPICYINEINRVYIAASISINSTEDFVCASTPAIDNNMRFGGTTVLHEGVENSRGDKIRKICRYSTENNISLKLHVCWITRTGDNCCVCEKCARTLLNILSEGYNPNDFGFDMSKEKYDEILRLIQTKKMNIPYMFWADIINGLSFRQNLIDDIPLVKYLVEEHLEYGKNYKKIMKPTEIIDLSANGKNKEQDSKALIFRSKQDFSTLDSSFASVGMNSGNQVFYEALKKNLNLTVMPFNEYVNIQDDHKTNKVVTTDLIWINENSNFDYLYNQLSKMKYQSMIPISVGLQAHTYTKDFKLNDSVMRVLSAIQERAIIGVRGDYTASILEKHGITNFEVIGCPSMYYWGSKNHQIKKREITPENVVVNFRTFYGQLNREEKHFLSYAANRKYSFIEQTKYDLMWDNVRDTKYYEYVSKWLARYKKIFFSVSEWQQYMVNKDFSMGARFHGNVVALWENVPALFIAIDSRTEELIRYFNLPYIKMDEFDDRKPIGYYYDLADYTTFNKEYGQKYMKYQEFLKKNGLVME